MATEKQLSILASPTMMAAEVIPGVAARVWKGNTADGTAVALLVVAVATRVQSEELDQHLATNPDIEAQLEIVSAEEAFKRVFSH